MPTASHTASAFRHAVESGDLEGMVAALAPEVVLHSPVAFRPFEGVAAVRLLFSVLLEVFEGFRYTDELAGEDPSVHALVFRARVGGREVEGLDLLRCGGGGGGGRVTNFTVMVRPLTAAIALAEAVGPRLAAAGYAKPA